MRFFKPNIDRLRERRDIPALMKAYSDRDVTISLAALDALIDLGQAAALLESHRQHAAWKGWLVVEERAKGRLGRDAVPTLSCVLVRADPEAQAGTPRHLLGFFPEAEVQARAARHLLSLLPMPDAPRVESSIVDKLVDVLPTLASRSPFAARDTASGLARLGQGSPQIESRVLSALTELARSDSPGARIAALESLSPHGPAAIDHLVAALSDPARHIRDAALRLLEREHHWKPTQDATVAAYCVARGDWERCVNLGAAAVEPLACVFDWHEGPWREALDALARVGDRGATDALWRLLGEARSRDVHDAALAALIGLQDRRAVVWGLGRPDFRERTVALLRGSGAEGVRAAHGRPGRQRPDTRRDRVAALYWVEQGDWPRCEQLGESALETVASAAAARSSRGAAGALARMLARTRVEIGPSIVKGLIGGLSEPERLARQDAADALLRFYESHRLTMEARQIVLAAARDISSPHTDGPSSNDCAAHNDYGVGLNPDTLSRSWLFRLDLDRQPR